MIFERITISLKNQHKTKIIFENITELKLKEILNFIGAENFKITNSTIKK